MTPLRRAAISIVPALCLLAQPARAEMIEEVIAWVNGDIITSSQYKQIETERVEEAYKKLSGEELAAELQRTRGELLLFLIDQKILVHQAKALGYDFDKLGEMFLQIFMDTNGVSDEEQLKTWIEASGMTMPGLRRRLIEMYAPEEVIRFEVTNRVSVGDHEIEAYYNDYPSLFRIEGEVTLREIVLLADDDASPCCHQIMVLPPAPWAKTRPGPSPCRS